MDLARDCLDSQLVDLNCRHMGRVDGIIIEIEEGKPPRVAFVESGVVTQAARLHPRLGRLVARLAKRFGVAESDPYRIPWSEVTPTGVNVTVGVEAEQTPAFAWEKWLRAKIIGRIPGA
jgi:sporulation protein YlmC with PRC-barrel domain